MEFLTQRHQRLVRVLLLNVEREGAHLVGVLHSVLHELADVGIDLLGHAFHCLADCPRLHVQSRLDGRYQRNLEVKVIALVDLELAVAELKVFNNHVFGLVVRFKNVSRTVIERTDHDIRIDEVHLCDLLHTSNRIL